MRLRQRFLTQNDCYQSGRTIDVRGVMVHSTGADNPWVSRYVPGDNELGRNQLNNHWDRPGLTKCVHAFIGKFADGEVGTVQTLPWNRRGWHGGGPSNNTHIGFEICEDGLTDPIYFRKAYQEAVELVAMLCRECGLDPLAGGVVICHAEGHQQGIASNHGDVLHWFPKHGKTMDHFRADVAQVLKGEDTMTYEQWKEYMARYLKEREAMPVPDWAGSNGEWEAARKSGIITASTRPQALCTKAEAAAFALRGRG